MYGNPYNTNLYQPYNRGYVNYQPPLYQSQNFQQPPIYRSQLGDAPIQGIKFLTADEIKAYIVMPNCREMLIDKANGEVHIKSADTMGQSSEQIYKYEEVVENKPLGENEPNKAQTTNNENLVKKDDLNGFVKSDELAEFIKQTNDKLEKLEKKIKISEIMGEK